MNIKSLLYTIRTVNLWKTIYFNFHYFPFRTAVKLPFYVCWRTVLCNMRGVIIIEAPIRRGMVMLGIHDLGIQDSFYSRTIWKNSGTLIVKGSANIGRGSKLCIGGTLILGDKFRISGDSEIICQRKITFGRNCLLSWNILIMDGDLHHIYSADDKVINEPKSISIGSHVWIGCRSTILKGVSVADNCIIAAGSVITNSYNTESCIVGGVGDNSGILKSNIKWGV